MDGLLHDINLIREVAEDIFSILKAQHGFVAYPSDPALNSSDTASLSIRKNDLILSFFISAREGFEIDVREVNWPHYKKVRFLGLFDRIYQPFSKERESILAEMQKRNSLFEKYTRAWYNSLMSQRIDFLIMHFPKIFENGNLDELGIDS